MNDKYKSVVVLNSLDGGLAAQWVLDNSILVESVVCLDSSEQDLWYSLLNLCFWSSEGGVGPHLCLDSSMSAFLHSGSC